MKAIVQTEYGSPDVLSLAEVEKPIVSGRNVLVKVHASSINSADWRLMRGTPFLVRLMYGGLRKPKIQTLGVDFAGRVEAVGPEVTQFQPGDEVFGELSEYGFGGFAEYVCAAETALVRKPMNITFEQAATVPDAAIAALQALRDCGQLQSGQRVLINGASSGVGGFAVQIAKAFGAEVTAVCHPNKMEMVRTIGADHIIDYTQTDVTQQGQQYDLIVDMAAYRSVFDYLPILTRSGSYVLVGGSISRLFQVMLFFGPWISRTSQRSVKCLTSKPNQADLMVLSDLLEAGKIVPFIDRSYPLSEVPIAIRYVEERHVQGKVAINIG
jgi:NADPH:quinone reductase-like Zn-dependent oxidoreductase